MQNKINRNIDNYVNNQPCTEQGLINKLLSCVRSVGIQTIYLALKLYYVTENPKCPAHIKATIFTALAYLICPLDAIPDFTPIIGYSDDLGALSFALGLASLYIDDTVICKARCRMVSLFGKEVLSELSVA